jgi:molybdopterin converting factor small subunit
MRSSARDAAPVVALIPALLRSYTAGASRVELALADGASVGDALAQLEARYRGFRFRIVDEQGAIRPHIRIFADGNQVRDLAEPLRAGAELMIVGALSGG